MGGFSAAALSQGGDCQVIPRNPQATPWALSHNSTHTATDNGNISEFMGDKRCFALPLALPSFSSSGLGKGPSFLLHGDQCCESPQALRTSADLCGLCFGGRSWSTRQDQIPSETWLRGHWATGHFSMTNQYTLSISGVNQLIWRLCYTNQTYQKRCLNSNSNSRPFGGPTIWTNLGDVGWNSYVFRGCFGKPCRHVPSMPAFFIVRMPFTRFITEICPCCAIFNGHWWGPLMIFCQPFPPLTLNIEFKTWSQCSMIWNLKWRCAKGISLSRGSFRDWWRTYNQLTRRLATCLIHPNVLWLVAITTWRIIPWFAKCPLRLGLLTTPH